MSVGQELGDVIEVLGKKLFLWLSGLLFRLPGLVFLPDFHLCLLSLLGKHTLSHWACFSKLIQSFSIHVLLSVGLILNEHQTVCPRLPKKLCVKCQRDPIKTFSLPHLHFGILSQPVWLGYLVQICGTICDHR